MARKLISAFGPRVDEDSMIYVQAGSVANTTVVTATAVDAHTPTQGTYWVKLVKTGVAALKTIVDSVGITAPDFSWLCIREFVYEGTNASSLGSICACATTLDLAANPLRVALKATSSTQFKVEIRRAGGGATILLTSSTTTFAKDDVHSLRIECDGTNLELWVDGTSEGTAAYTGKIDSTFLQLGTSDGAGQPFYINNLATFEGTARADRPNVDVEITRTDPTGDGDTLQFGGQASGGAKDCTDTAKGDWSHWNMGASDKIDTADFNCDNNNDDHIESSATANVTPGKVLAGVMLRGAVGATNGSKTVTTNLRISDGTSSSEVGVTNVTWTDTRAVSAAFPLAPDGGAWTQTDLDNLEIGVHSEDPGGDVEDEKWPAIWALVVSVSDDPPATGVVADPPPPADPGGRSISVVPGFDPILMSRPEGAALRDMERAIEEAETHIRDARKVKV